MRKILLFALLVLLAPQIAPAQISGAGQVGCSGSTIAGTGWTSGTANNTAQALLTNTPAAAALVQIDQTTTLTGGVVTFQFSNDGGANFSTVPVSQVLNPSTGAQLTNPYTLVASTNQSFLIILAGSANLQIKLTTAITGSGTITPYTTPLCTLPGAYERVGITGNAAATLDQAPGSAAPANVLAEGLKDTNGNSEAALSDVTGRQITKSYPDTTSTSYHASANVASASSATDIAVLPGNATNTVLVYRITASCTQTTAGIITLQIIKRSAADTSGTHSNMTVVPDDANYSAGVSVPLTYTANPTAGTAIGNVDTSFTGCLASSSSSPNDMYIFKPAKPIVLRGTAQQLAVNLNGVTVTGGSFDVTFDYVETTTP